MGIPTQHLRVVSYDQPAVCGCATELPWADPDLPQAQELRTRYDLAAVAGDGPEWSQVLRLLDWVHRRASHNGFAAASSYDALDLLRHAEAGGAFRCVEYGRLLCQVLCAVGIPARVVYLRRRNPEQGYGRGHVVCEAWVNDWRKWVLLDPQCNAHWTYGGVPQGALELRRLWLTGRIWLASRKAPGWLGKLTWAPYFHHLVFIRPGNLAPLRYWDHRHPPTFEFQGLNVAEEATSDPSRINVSCNATTIQLRSPAPGEPFTPELLVELSHSAPWFAGYQLRFDGGPWLRTDGSEPVLWCLKPGQNTVEAHTVNTRGRTGIPSRITLEFLG